MTLGCLRVSQGGFQRGQECQRQGNAEMDHGENQGALPRGRQGEQAQLQGSGP